MTKVKTIQQQKIIICFWRRKDTETERDVVLVEFPSTLEIKSH